MRIRNKTRSFTVPPGRAGFSLLEILLGALVLVIAVLGTMASITSAAVVSQSTRETTLAHKAAQRMLEQLHAMPCREVVSTFNQNPSDDIGGAGTAPGQNFAVAGLNPRDGDPDGLAGRIRLALEDSGADQIVKEDLALPSFGLPRDLNGDGAIDGDDHAADYIIMPVRVLVEWTGASGDRAIEVESILGVQ